jgi:hypothetical protein
MELTVAEVSSTSFDHPEPVRFSLLASSKTLRFTWFGIFTLTVFSEVYPFPLIPPLPFYSIWCAKLLLFLVLGYMAPLTFWHFNALNRGILLAAGSASFVEGLQGILGHGHAFHWHELLVKLALILLGFIAGLEAVHDREISIGRLRIRLARDHFDNFTSHP